MSRKEKPPKGKVVFYGTAKEIPPDDVCRIWTGSRFDIPMTTKTLAQDMKDHPENYKDLLEHVLVPAGEST